MFRSKLSLTIFSITILLALPSCMQTTDQIKTVSDEMQETSRSNNSANKIKLFIYPACPYCQKVLSFLRSNGNLEKVEVVDATNAQHFAELKELNNGNTQCPFIYDQEHNVKMLESQDIMNYFKRIFAA